MVEIITLAILFGPPAASVVALHIYYRFRRRRGKRIGQLKSMIFNIPLSLLSGQWISFVIDRSESLGIPPADRVILERFKDTLEGLPFLDLIPAEYRLLIVLTILILLILLPGP